MAERTAAGTDIVAEVKDWLSDNWDPDLPVAEWWERLGTAGWAVPTWPSEWFGRDLSRDEGNRVQQAITDFGALRAGCVSITPLHLDMTSYKTLDLLQNWKF